jgi:hypothetical protein
MSGSVTSTHLVSFHGVHTDNWFLPIIKSTGLNSIKILSLDNLGAYTYN